MRNVSRVIKEICYYRRREGNTNDGRQFVSASFGLRVVPVSNVGVYNYGRQRYTRRVKTANGVSNRKRLFVNLVTVDILCPVNNRVRANPSDFSREINTNKKKPRNSPRICKPTRSVSKFVTLFTRKNPVQRRTRSRNYG